MSRTFNCGIGGVLVVKSADSQEVTDRLINNGVQASIIGTIINREGNII
jgi:phosphoribosylaminoimidazole (AIR) synthetase